jgi:hypothetical protein
MRIGLRAPSVCRKVVDYRHIVVPIIILISCAGIWLIGFNDGRSIVVGIFLTLLYLVHRIGAAIRRFEEAAEFRHLWELCKQQQEIIRLGSGKRTGLPPKEWKRQKIILLNSEFECPNGGSSGRRARRHSIASRSLLNTE